MEISILKQYDDDISIEFEEVTTIDNDTGMVCIIYGVYNKHI